MSRDVRAGGAFIELGVRSAIDKGLAKAQKKITNFGRRLAATGGTMAAASAGLLAAPVAAAAESQEVLSKFNTVFGESAEGMLAWSNTTAEALGVSESAMQQMLGSMQDLLVPMGVMGDKASGMTQGLSSLAVDLASFNNMNVSDVFRDMMAAMTGSSEVLAKYGVVVNETIKKQEALRLGLISSEKDAMTPAIKAQATYSLIMKGTIAAQGDAVRTAGSFTNQMKRLRAGISNFLSDAGAPLLDTLAGIVGKATGAIKATRGWMQENQQLVKVAVMAVAGVGVLGGLIATLGAASLMAGLAIGGIASALAFLMSPIGLLVAGLGGLVAYFFSVFGSMGEMMNWFNERFGGLVTGVKDSMTAIMAALGDGNFAEAWDIILETMEMAWIDLTTEIYSTWTDTLKKLVDGAVWGAQAIGSIFTAMAGAIVKTLDFVSKQQNWVKNRATEAMAKITGERIVGGDVFTGSALPPGADRAIRAAAAGIGEFGETIKDGAAQLGEETKKGLDQRKADRKARLEELKAGMAARAEIVRDAKAAGQADAGLEAPKLPGAAALAQAAGGGTGAASSSRGTFSSFGAFALGTRGASTQVKIEKNTARTAKAAEETAKEAKKQKGTILR